MCVERAASSGSKGETRSGGKGECSGRVEAGVSQLFWAFCLNGQLQLSSFRQHQVCGVGRIKSVVSEERLVISCILKWTVNGKLFCMRFYLLCLSNSMIPMVIMRCF